MLVFWLNTSSFSASFDRSIAIGPICLHDTEKFDGSSFNPSGWRHPPFLACEMWHAMPGTCGSSKTLTHTLSLGESALNVVLTQLKSVACAERVDITTSTASVKSHFIGISPHWSRRHALAISYSDFGPPVFKFFAPFSAGFAAGKAACARAAENRRSLSARGAPGFDRPP